jgi:hypothetical protein
VIRGLTVFEYVHYVTYKICGGLELVTIILVSSANRIGLDLFLTKFGVSFI